jgi:hypothetical protein
LYLLGARKQEKYLENQMGTITGRVTDFPIKKASSEKH